MDTKLLSYCSTLALTIILSGCVKNEVTDSDEIHVTSMQDDLKQRLSDISDHHGSGIAVSQFKGGSSNLTIVNWCGDESDVLTIRNETTQACVFENGVNVNGWCYDPRTTKPHFFIEVGLAGESHVECSDSTEWQTSLTTPSSHYTNLFWLSDARAMGFLTSEQIQQKKRLMGSISQMKKHEQRSFFIEEQREQIQGKYSNKSAIQGSYGKTVCKWDADFKTLEGVTIGRVLATYDNQFQLELVDYQSLSKPNEQFPKGKIITGNYEDWGLCNG